jgi:hypothetical protein
MTGKCQGIIGPYEKQIQNVFFSETIEPFESNFGLDAAYKNVWFVLCRSEIQSTHTAMGHTILENEHIFFSQKLEI